VAIAVLPWLFGRLHPMNTRIKFTPFLMRNQAMRHYFHQGNFSGLCALSSTAQRPARTTASAADARSATAGTSCSGAALSFTAVHYFL
jgi:hypothetical protein